MDYKEKYEMALERAKMEMSKDGMKNDVIARHLAETIFPELIESEDEKIRKALIDGFTVMKESKNCGKTFSNHNIPVADIIAWLEKQGKQKSLNDVAKEITKNKETATSFLKSCGIMNANGELADEYKIRQNEQKLSESEDEKIRKVLIDILESDYTDDAVLYGLPKQKFIAWLKKQDMERRQLYIRFGDIPSNEKSKIYRGEEEIGDENGVSVYPAFELNGNIVLGLTLPITKTTLYTQQHLLEYDNRPCYLVSGDYVGKGIDGEPLIRNISIIKRLNNYRIKESENQDEKDTLEDAILGGNEDGLIAATIEYSKKKPKFKIGDFIANDYCFGKVIALTDDAYLLDTEQGIPFSCEHNVHLWTIADVRNGDVLVNWNNTIFIFKAIENETIKFHIAYNEKWDAIKTPSTKLSHLGFPEPQFEFHPATEEQRNLLFRKMKEAGYEWDARNKVMTKIEQKPADSYCQENCKGFQETGKCFADGECKAKREAEQKSIEWSEDEKIRKELIGILSKYKYFYSKEIAWLKSLEDRVQPKQEWSEEDKDYYDAIIAKLEVTQEDAALTDNQMDFLKSLKPQRYLIPSEEEIEKAAQEWESKANFNPFYMTMENGKPTGVKQSITTHKESFKAGVNWILKFLKGKVKPQWKPSELQLGCLSDAIEYYNLSGYPAPKLKELLDDLKKLKES